MHVRKGLSLAAVGIGTILVFAAGLLLVPPRASAQCGTQMSSCKNCHEVQAALPVNADGTGWHQSHAFGDFCQFCHSGNVQSMVKEEAHKGMVAPLDDIQASCANCHPADMLEKANVYAATLGVKVSAAGSSGGTGAAAAGGGEEPAADAPSAQAAAPVEEAVAPEADSAPPALVIGEGEIIDYNKRYAESTDEGIQFNAGDVILVFLILAVLLGGGAFVYFNEKRLRGSAPHTAKPAESQTGAPLRDLNDYPREVLALLPQLEQLTPAGRRALQLLLQDPAQASELLYSLSQIDADLLLRVRNLDDKARSLLVALSGA